MARQGLEAFTERCKVLWLFFFCREETARGEPLARPSAGIPTRVSRSGNGLWRSGQLPGSISDRQLSREPPAPGGRESTGIYTARDNSRVRVTAAVVTCPDTLEIHIPGPAAAEDAFALPTCGDPPNPRPPLRTPPGLMRPGLTMSPAFREHVAAAGT